VEKDLLLPGHAAWIDRDAGSGKTLFPAPGFFA
jgi:hypothetical protein